MIKKIIIGCDHLGRELKDSIKEHLISKGIEVNDIGVNSDDAVDYPDIGKELSKKVQQKEYERGILVCGTGAGMAIVANKFSKWFIVFFLLYRYSVFPVSADSKIA